MKVVPDWMSAEALETLNKGYLQVGESPKDMFHRLSEAAARYLKRPDLEGEFFEMFWNGWLGPASPVAANFGTTRALPISCYSVHVSDSISSIYSHLKETAALSKNGGGVGIYLGDVRPSGSPFATTGKATGVAPVARLYDQTAAYVSQGGVRRGSFAAYLPIDHPDVPELLRAKDHSKGDPRTFIDSNLGLTITDEWLESMIAGDSEKQELFGEVLRTRLVSGSPYLIFIDNVNRQNPPCYAEHGLKVSTSNLCSEITLHTDENHSFVCCLSSLNLARYDEWRDWVGESGKGVIELSIYFLDAVMTEFIQKTSGKFGMGRARRFAEKSRALGLGTMGYHSYLQKHMVPFESPEARHLNIQLHGDIRMKAERATHSLAEEYGVPEWCEGTGRRNTHLLAIAPTRTNAVISGAFSQGIEPIDSNYFAAVQAKGTFVRKNPQLEELLCDKGIGDEVWDEILANNGSVLTLDCLTPEEKDVFKTAREIDSMELVKQAADRQPFICQAQSLNLFVDPDISAERMFQMHLAAWKNGVKSLYYLKSSSPLKIKEAKEEPTVIVVTKDGCPYCTKLKEQLKLDGKNYRELTRQEAESGGYWKTQFRTVPQLWEDGVRLGGYTEYMQKYHQGEKQDSEGCAACEG
jgi:ribonucleoside-diphosphate reductase alpha chain